MTNRQQRQDDHNRARPHSERPLASLRTMEAHERCDQQAIPALEHDRRRRNGDQRQWAPSLDRFSQRVGTLKKRGCHERAAAGTRRTRAPLRTLGGSRLGGIPSFSAAASETPSAVARVESAVVRFRIAISFLGQLDHAGGLGCELAARHCPQFRQIVVPPAGSAAGHRMDGMLGRPSRDQATCSVSCAQPEQ